jgi:hypothetical protein
MPVWQKNELHQVLKEEGRASNLQYDCLSFVSAHHWLRSKTIWCKVISCISVFIIMKVKGQNFVSFQSTFWLLDSNNQFSVLQLSEPGGDTMMSFMQLMGRMKFGFSLVRPICLSWAPLECKRRAPAFLVQGSNKPIWAYCTSACIWPRMLPLC